MGNLSYTAFENNKKLMTGTLDVVALRMKKRLKVDPKAMLLLFNDQSGKQMDLDLSGSDADVLQRLQVFLAKNEVSMSPGGPGRPKLGVVAREVSLLPRHWEWLATQSGGASATLRRLLDEAKKQSLGSENKKSIQERTYQVMVALAGNLPDYEEALRALYKSDKKAFLSRIRQWPDDIKEHIKKLSSPLWENGKE